MQRLFLVFLFSISYLQAQRADTIKTIHVFVALCDNENQGIVPVSNVLGNGQDPKNNLYWGALYGIKTHFKKSDDWEYLGVLQENKTIVLERILFKHKKSNTYLLADAYDGKYIKEATVDFLEATAGCKTDTVKYTDLELRFGGNSKLLSYIGHDGLMEFNVTGNFIPEDDAERDAIILACISKDYFKPYIKKSNANPLVWSTGLMSPEAYTLKWAIEGWIKGESNLQIRERAAQAYHKYQKCGINAARNLLVTGF